MIIILKKNLNEAALQPLRKLLLDTKAEYKDVLFPNRFHIVISTNWQGKTTDLDKYSDVIEKVIEVKTEYQLCTRNYQKENSVISIGNGIEFGSDKTVVMAGPCGIESEYDLMKTAEFLAEKCGLKVFRAGAFKPRTSPYSFPGFEFEGLKLLDKVRSTFGMKIITEVKDDSHLDAVADCADIIQIGTKSMYIYNMLAKCGKFKKPVLLKRAFMATIKEYLQAVDFIMAAGNPQVILCERGIRAFEPMTRFSLDVCSAALIKEISHLPMVLDPSHAMGRANQVPLVAQAAAGMGADGLLIEVHHDPSKALTDKDQTLSCEQFKALLPRLKAICNAVDKKIV